MHQEFNREYLARLWEYPTTTEIQHIAAQQAAQAIADGFSDICQTFASAVEQAADAIANLGHAVLDINRRLLDAQLASEIETEARERLGEDDGRSPVPLRFVVHQT